MPRCRHRRLCRRSLLLVRRLAPILIILSAMICLFASVLFLLSPTSVVGTADSLLLQPPPYLQAHHLGWGTRQLDWCPCREKDGKWNILYHLGGNGPWIEKVDGVVEGGIDVPEGCKVDMAHMMSRHGERYPTKTSGARMLALISRLKSTGILQGDLNFLNSWEYFTKSPDQHFEQLTTTGPFSGVLETFTTGVKLRTRYGHLLNSTSHSLPTHVWASESDRVIDTARHFSAGFFGLESKRTKLQVVPETPDRGGDTLTPGDTCRLYSADSNKGHDYGQNMLAKYQSAYAPAIAARIISQNPELGLAFTPQEVFSMQEMCGYETLVRGQSPWCKVFTKQEWSQFEYARDVIHFYRAGPGNPYSRAMGWLWLNATANLLLEGPEAAGPLYFSFVHDGDIVPMLSALGIFEDDHDLPVTHIDEDRRWKTSQITPMGGRIIFERLTCGGSETYVRFNVNDGIVALPGCSSGPGKSCPLHGFKRYVQKRGRQAGDFRTVCGLKEDAPDRLTFLRQPGYPKKGEEQV